MTDEQRRWWSAFEALRRVTVFLLGVLIIVSGLIDPESDNTISMLVIGMIMVGVLPIENVFLPWTRRRRDDAAKSLGSTSP